MILPILARLAVVLFAIVAAGGCRRASPPPLDPQVSGSLGLPGLSAPARVVRDRWGIPHIYARTQDDLFFVQGFVQAQDRLFQMDLWRRSTQGRLSEVLGPNFIDRDAMTRRMRFHGDMDREWASYAPDAKAIAQAFVRGVNAWVVMVRDNPPQEFVLAGWRPELWQAEDLLSRAEAFSMSGNALSEVLRARIVAAVGAKRAADLLPLDPPSPAAVPAGLDVTAIDYVIGDVLRSIGAPPFFLGLARPLSDSVTPVSAGGHEVGTPFPAAPAVSPDLSDHSALRSITAGKRSPDPLTEVALSGAGAWADQGRGGSNDWVVAGRRSGTGRPLVANDPHRALDHPSLRYLVHLNAPGWNVIGAVVPWFPGVAIGHNDHVAWGLTIFDADVQDLYVEHVNPANPRQVDLNGRWIDVTVVKDAFRVKGRRAFFEFETVYTPHGVVIATDKARHLAFTLRWTGAEPGTAGYLAAVSLDRATSADEFRGALARWKMPGENFVFADTGGHIGYQAAALVPVRRTWDGTLPVPGWTGAFEWDGWYGLDDLPHAADPPAGWIATANNNTLALREQRIINFRWGSPARINRIRDVFAETPAMDVARSKALQHDVLAWNAQRLVPLLASLHGDRPAVEEARGRLLAWDRRMTADSAEATLYFFWESALMSKLAEGKLPKALTADYLSAVDDVLVPALTQPTRAWFDDSRVAASRDHLLIAALGAAVDALATRAPSPGQRPWGRVHTATFRHPLGVTAAARALFNIGPFARPGYGDTVMAAYGAGTAQDGGASFREIIDVGEWDRSVVTNAPGQSGSPRSPHFADLAKLWAVGEYVPMSFSEGAVQGTAETTLTLVPADRPRPE